MAFIVEMWAGRAHELSIPIPIDTARRFGRDRMTRMAGFAASTKSKRTMPAPSDVLLSGALSPVRTTLR